MTYDMKHDYNKKTGKCATCGRHVADEDAAVVDCKPSDRLFIGIHAAGVGYCDRTREVSGDYVRLAFMPYATLELQWDKRAKLVAPDLVPLIEKDVAAMRERAGQSMRTSQCGSSVLLGEQFRRDLKETHAEFQKELQAIAAAGGRTVEYVFMLWRDFERENVDQSALLCEFRVARAEQLNLNCASKHSPDGEHDGYWIEKGVSFRCYHCGFQFYPMSMKKPTPVSRIEECVAR